MTEDEFRGRPTATLNDIFSGSGILSPTQTSPNSPLKTDLVEGTKFDGGKARYDLIPPEALDELAHLYAFGASKYADRNWEKGINYSRVFAALMRHAWAWWRGERIDPETGLSHMASVAWNAFALFTYDKRGMTQYNDNPYMETKNNG